MFDSQLNACDQATRSDFVSPQKIHQTAEMGTQQDERWHGFENDTRLNCKTLNDQFKSGVLYWEYYCR